MNKSVKRTGKNIGRILALIAVLIAFLLTMGFVLTSAGLMDDFIDLFNPTFRVVVDGKSYRGTNGTLILPDEGDIIVQVKNVENCTIKVLPNIDFNYIVDGESHKFSEIGELTNYFIKQENFYSDYFIIKCSENAFSVKNILQSVHGTESHIEISDLPNVYPYRLEFINDNDEIWIHFGQGSKYVEAELSNDTLVF